jgi:hypothetical protein
LRIKDAKQFNQPFTIAQNATAAAMVEAIG